MKVLRVAVSLSLFFGTISSTKSQSDKECDDELRKFDEALVKREMWALESKFFLDLCKFYLRIRTLSVRYLG